jgi:hypothetical protein
MKKYGGLLFFRFIIVYARTLKVGILKAGTLKHFTLYKRERNIIRAFINNR